uniref:Uncharacterized protein n=1 Tax=Anguilla anguilla TaxID=7936 RepID=A0A0E9TKU6_ANGAN
MCSRSADIVVFDKIPCYGDFDHSHTL